MNDPDDVGASSSASYARQRRRPGHEFGDDGRTLILRFDEIAGALTTARVRSIAIAPDGRIVMAARADVPVLRIRFAVAQLDADGHLDTAFGDAGVVQELPVPTSFLDAGSLGSRATATSSSAATRDQRGFGAHGRDPAHAAGRRRRHVRQQRISLDPLFPRSADRGW